MSTGMHAVLLRMRWAAVAHGRVRYVAAASERRRAARLRADLRAAGA